MLWTTVDYMESRERDTDEAQARYERFMKDFEERRKAEKKQELNAIYGRNAMFTK